MIYLQLFLSFLQIGAFSFGGGYAAMPMIQGQVVDARGWLTIGEFTDLITISQMTPGPIAVNSATFVGLRVAGFMGAVAATIGCILPSCIIVSVLAWVYLKYRKMSVMQEILRSLRPAVVAMIASAGLIIIVSSFWGTEETISAAGFKIQNAVIFAAALFLLKKKNMSPVLVMVLAGVCEVLFGLATGLLQ